METSHLMIEFTPLFKSKELDVDLKSEQEFRLKMNDQLADLLLNNLLSNAINHNLKGGTINLVIKQNELTICNTGEPNSLTDDTIFNRFTRGSSKSYGLGLAIVRKICDTHGLRIHYTKDRLHCFTIGKDS
jgi:signal transduction histidine kinase